MSRIVSFVDYMPPPRYDGTSYTTVTVEEAPAAAGPWTPIHTIAITPDTDPSEPAPRSFTTNHATLDDGWYRVTFADALSNTSNPSAPQHDVVGAEEAYAPSVADIGKILRARTRDTNGVELGTFTQATRPTADDVARLIQRGVRAVALSLNFEVPAVLVDDARDAAALYAAMMVELSYMPEQAAGRAPNTVYDELRTLWEESLAQLVAAKVALGTDEEPGTADDAVGGIAPPWYRFDDLVGCPPRAPGAEYQTWPPCNRLVW